jgi:hypothetical protein
LVECKNWTAPAGYPELAVFNEPGSPDGHLRCGRRHHGQSSGTHSSS